MKTVTLASHATSASRTRAGIVLAVAGLLVLSGCTGAGPDRAASPQPSQSSTAAPVAPGVTAAGCRTAGLDRVPAVAAAVAPSVVTVLVPGGGTGSGVVYRTDGLVLTNEHVVGGHTSVRVEFADGRQAKGTVKATDPVTDLALVDVDRGKLPAASFQTALPPVGSLSVVIGSPLGFQNTVTAGVISGVHRAIPGSASQGQSLVDLIQTDAPISPGNSGGAVVDGCGKVIGISEAYIPPQAGAVALGFAIPAATAVSVADQLEKTGHVSHAFAGLTPAAITPEIASELQLSSTEGVIVAAVVAGGPSEKAGLRSGDIITAAGGKKTPTPEDFLAVLRSRRAGDRLPLTIQRPGQGQARVTLTLADRP
jgi:S1-C subfamily serine protease